MNADSLLDVSESGAAMSPQDRLVASANLSLLIRNIAIEYGLGEVLKYSEIAVGYEDCNLIIETSSGKYVAKLFARNRTIKEVDRYLEIMNKITAAKVRHPQLLTTKDGQFTVKYQGVWAVLAKFIDGQTFYELNRAPSVIERKTIIAEIAKINQIVYHPEYIAGSWIVPKFYEMFELARPHLTAEEIRLVEAVAWRYDKIPFDRLERGFIHGDLRTTNVLLGSDGHIYLLDYFLANHFIKVQELAVAIATLFYDQTSSKSLEEICHDIADEHGHLSADDRHYLVDYTLAVFAMELLGGTYARYVQGNLSVENTYWLERGRGALVKYVDSEP